MAVEGRPFTADGNYDLTRSSSLSAVEGRPFTADGNLVMQIDGNWNALSLPFAVGPDGRIARLNAAALPPAK